MTVCWKTASRWDEITRLQWPQSFLSASPEEIIIDWGQATKSSRLDPHRAARFVVVVCPSTAEIFDLLSRLPPGPITSVTTSALTRALRSAHPASNL
eukprot:CAMPEP_0176416590 /NCGR_PEP_ID=MMETSP0127-20121128/6429_1 /TAXON_ID=938130 /ORGANISM="Platyophrya macrostoma, Strain WH" /LENGTH=96 /DNA_ID=CAMNT_0017796679 /DNA_START=69 /DNA_END=355 /DNA_ORIENTATION=-